MDPELLFELFAEICRVPRESGNELGMQRFLEAFAAANSFTSRADNTGNLVINVPARGTGMSAGPIVLQSHTDMVCVKAPESTHDFTHDPIVTRIETREDKGVRQQVLLAKGTTLGADNGIGVAAALAAATDPTIVNCPPLELLFTVDEERGLTGATTLDASLIEGRYLINMDTEELGEICISCAGGRDLTCTWPATRSQPGIDRTAVTVSLIGFPGGHSGVQINEGRGNAIEALIGELLASAGGAEFGLADITGGSRRNVIPSTAQVTVWCDAELAGRLTAHFRSVATLDRIRSGVRVGGDGIKVTVSQAGGGGEIPWPLTYVHSETILRAIAAIQWGPQQMSAAVPGLVETSNNVAVISTSADQITLCCSTRSSKSGAIAEFQTSIAPALEASGAPVAYSDGYPGWEADTENPLLKQAQDTFTQVLGYEPKITAVHAGLECGVIKGIIPDMRMISFGPDILDAHTIQERVLLNSVPVFYSCLTALLGDLCR